MNGPRASLLTRLTLIPLALLAGVNVWLVVGFWGSLGGGDPLPFQIFGGCIAVIEITFLVVSADAKARGEVTKARIWRGVFMFVLLANVIADFGAIAAKTRADTDERTRAIVLYDAAVQQDAEASAEIARLGATLEARGLRLPSAALEANLRSLEERRARFEAGARLPPRGLVDEIARIESAVAVARVIAAETVRRDEARAQLRAAGARPDEANAQIDGLIGLAGVVGVRLDAEDVRVVLAAALALVCKLVLVFGFWAVTPRLANDVHPSTEAAQVAADGQARPQIAQVRRARRAPQTDASFERAIDDLENGVV